MFPTCALRPRLGKQSSIGQSEHQTLNLFDSGRGCNCLAHSAGRGDDKMNLPLPHLRRLALSTIFAEPRNPFPPNKGEDISILQTRQRSGNHEFPDWIFRCALGLDRRLLDGRSSDPCHKQT